MQIQSDSERESAFQRASVIAASVLITDSVTCYYNRTIQKMNRLYEKMDCMDIEIAYNFYLIIFKRKTGEERRQ